MSLDNIPEIKLECSGRAKYRVSFGTEVYTLFISQILETLISLSWETDDATGQKYFYIRFNPNFFAPGTPKKYWEPPIVHEIFEAKNGPEKEKSDELANKAEAEYCLKYFLKEEQTQYLGMVASILGKNHPKYKFLEERLR
ncbi:hypothetical protein AYK26_04715 [Euryarchaeota archaeon SM23-78]|nr:MAG: hypothetical protein AYK26_04715 [Euryarchaeota archaeon SM23-78]MBW3001177.1 hypothetical protein [Candidatus Woesearchaeota archaeon]